MSDTSSRSISNFKKSSKRFLNICCSAIDGCTKLLSKESILPEISGTINKISKFKSAIIYSK